MCSTRASGGAAAVGVLGQRREPEGDAREVLDDAVVQVSRDPPALLGRRLDRAGQQGLALAVSALEPPATDQASGIWKSSSTSSPPSSGGASALSSRDPFELTDLKRW